MPTDRIRYIDPDATGAGNGLTLADAYTSAVAALAGEIGDPNLVTNDERLVFECHSSAGSADTGGFPQVTSSWTTDTTRYVLFRPYTGNEASTAWSTSKYRLAANVNGLAQQRDIRFENIQIDAVRVAASQSLFTFSSGGSGYRALFGCYIRYSGTGGSSNAAVLFSSDVALLCKNNIFDGWPQQAIWNTRTGGPVSYYHNNTFINCVTNIQYTTADLAAVKNNLSSGSTNDFIGTYAAGSGYNSTSSVSLGYTVTGGSTGDRLSQTFTFAGASDYALTGSDTGARTYGVALNADPNLAVTHDINGTVRGGTVDIGAHQVTLAGLLIDSVPTEVKVESPFDVVVSGATTTPTVANTTIKLVDDTGPAATTNSVTGTGPYTINATFPRTTNKLFDRTTGYPLFIKIDPGV